MGAFGYQQVSQPAACLLLSARSVSGPLHYRDGCVCVRVDPDITGMTGMGKRVDLEN